MRRILFAIFCLIGIISNAQPERPVVNFDVTRHHYGKVQNTNTLLSVFTVTNTGASKLFILRVVAGRKIRYQIPPYGIETGDTAGIRIYYKPDRKGRFNEKIIVYTNASDKPITLVLSGEIKSLSSSPTECYSFSMGAGVVQQRPVHRGKVIDKETRKDIMKAKVYFYSSGQLVTTALTLGGEYAIGLNPGLYTAVATANGYDTVYKRDVYINKNTEPFLFELSQPKIIVTDVTIIPVDSATKSDYPPDIPGQLSFREYNPNNVVFLIDISASMRGADRLPFLKTSLKTMVSQLRSIDRLAIITYGDEANVYVTSVPVTNKEYLYKMIDTLVARGGTAGSQGLQLAYEVILDNFIDDANNQIILATDGEFEVSTRDELKIRLHAGPGSLKKIYLTTVGFGRSKTNLEKLKELAGKGGGSYVYINSAEVAETALLNEIKYRSKKVNR